MSAKKAFYVENNFFLEKHDGDFFRVVFKQFDFLFEFLTVDNEPFYMFLTCCWAIKMFILN